MDPLKFSFLPRANQILDLASSFKKSVLLPNLFNTTKRSKLSSKMHGAIKMHIPFNKKVFYHTATVSKIQIQFLLGFLLTLGKVWFSSKCLVFTIYWLIEIMINIQKRNSEYLFWSLLDILTILFSWGLRKYSKLYLLNALIQVHRNSDTNSDLKSSWYT